MSSPLVAAAQGSLEDAAIALATSDCRDVPEDAVRQALDDLARPIRIPPGASLVEKVARVTQHLFHAEGFRGDEDDYDAPRNSWIHEVLERRRGLPIVLSVVTIAVAGRAGVVLDPVGFPGHFLVAPREADPRFFVDPFHGGQPISERVLRSRLDQQAGEAVDDETFAAAIAVSSTHEVLVRMCNNLALSYLRRGDREGAARTREHLEALDGPHGPVVSLLRRFLDP